MKWLPVAYNTRDLEKDVKNKWRWEWLQEKDSTGEKFLVWLKKTDVGGVAFCEVCGKSINYKSNGKRALRLHAEDETHKKNKRVVKSNQVLPGSSKAKKETESMLDRIARQRAITTAFISEHCLPFTIAEDLLDLAKTLSEDKAALAKTTLSATSATYITTHGVARSLKEDLKAKLKDRMMSLNLDEATNNNNDKILNILVQFYDQDEKKVVLQHLGSRKQNLATAANILESIEEVLQEYSIEWSQVVSVLMDNCSTMRGVRGGVEALIRKKNPKLLDISGDTIHMVNNVTKTLMDCVDAGVQDFCLDLFYDIEESPKVKEIFHDLQSLMNSKKAKHLIRPISSRFLQMLDVSTRVIDLLDYLTVYYYGFLEEEEKSKYGLNIKNVTPADSGFYGCQGINSFGTVKTSGYVLISPELAPNVDTNELFQDVLHLNNENPEKGLKDGDKRNRGDDVEPSEETKNERPFCQQFKGSVCSTHIGNKSIYVTSHYAQGLAEKRIMDALNLIGNSKDLSDECWKYAIPSICHFSFPQCDTSSNPFQPARKRMICRDECEMLETKLCKNEHTVAKSHALTANSVLPKCSEIPDYKASCIRVGVPVPGYDDKCYIGIGHSFKGQHSKTKSGKKCMNWNHNPEFPIDRPAFSEILGDHNQCRNPNGSMAGPWCYTDNSFRYKELCEVPVCVEENSNVVVTIVPGILVPLVLVLLLALVGFCLQRNKNQKNKPVASVNNKDQNIELCTLTAKPASQKVGDFLISSVRFLHELDEGAFGKVYKGEVMGLYGDNAMTDVTIKTLKDTAAPKTQKEFRREVDMMSELRHPNIVCLLGVVMNQRPKCMLFEYMPLGDLHEYLIQHSPHSDMSVISDEDVFSDEDISQKVILEYQAMLNFAIQIASGMEYLASHHVVHRNLTASNVLVGDNLTLKISDFGLSRDIYSSDNYQVQNKSLLPVRWMPPETIINGKFTTESDIWAFGIVLWEIFSYGFQPYHGYSNQEVIEIIQSRHLLNSPEGCPDRMYRLMVECWHEMPMRRPSFRETLTRLRGWKSETTVQNLHRSLCQSHLNHSSTHQSSPGQHRPQQHDGRAPAGHFY